MLVADAIMSSILYTFVLHASCRVLNFPHIFKHLRSINNQLAHDITQAYLHRIHAQAFRQIREMGLFNLILASDLTSGVVQ